jgi:cyanophycin synthetase
MAGGVTLVELRVLEGPNLYFPRPAIKLTLAVPGWMALPEERFERLAGRVGDAGRAGRPGSEQRRRAAARVATQLTRRLASVAEVRLAVRGRSGAAEGQVVVAYPWRRRGAADAFGHEIAALLGALLDARRSPERAIADAAARLARVEPGEEPSVPDPTIPVIQVTGTNGKTTTVRLLAHLVRSAGRRVAYSSTDGVFRDDGLLVEAGDYSGFGGAARALAQDPDVAVLETARGGILLRGIGVLHNDVAVVTNISEDHLGLHGIDTLDQLAEVKASVTKITRADGWTVLNADDPRVLSMRRGATGRPWLCSVHPGHPAIRDVLAEGGRATTILDGWIVVLDHADARSIVRLEDVPVTIAGISTPNARNALEAASAALAIGLPERAVARGLRTFVLDPERNPGRANLFQQDGRVVVVDYAHNEAGMEALVELCDGLRRSGREIWLAICAAGDRTDTILHAFAYRAARGSDHLAIAELLHYLRGRERTDVVAKLRAGALDGGVDELDVLPDELAALRSMLGRASRGDVVAVTALGMRPEIFAWLDFNGAERLTPTRVRRLVRAVRASGDRVTTSVRRDRR